MLLYCIRHGESLYNLEGRIQGQTDVALSPLGERQSQALAADLATSPIDAVYSSPLKRAMQTAKPIALALNLDVRSDDRLKELHAGIFQGLLASELAERFPEAAAAWRSQDPDYRIPDGECRRDLMTRGRSVLEEIRERG